MDDAVADIDNVFSPVADGAYRIEAPVSPETIRV
jgi:hypothetical protein